MMKFIASSVDAATERARRALGEKAVIIAVRNLPSGDVEVSASDKPQPDDQNTLIFQQIQCLIPQPRGKTPDF